MVRFYTRTNSNDVDYMACVERVKMEVEMTEQVEIVVFNDKSYVRVKEYLKLKEENEQLKHLAQAVYNCSRCACHYCYNNDCVVNKYHT